MPFANSVDGTAIHYETFGVGRNGWVFLHGWGGASEFWGGFISDHSNPKNHRVVTISLRGHGQSGDRSDSHHFPSYVDDIISVADACGLDQFSLAGFSFGGKLATYLAAKQPERIKNMVLISPVGPGLVNFDKNVIREFCAEAGNISKLDAFFSGWIRQKLEVEVYKALLSSIAATSKVVLFDTVENLAWTDIRPEIDILTIPTLVIAGEHDPVYSVAYQQEQTLPWFSNSRFEVFDCGHFVPLEMPEALGKLIFKK